MHSRTILRCRLIHIEIHQALDTQKIFIGSINSLSVLIFSLDVLDLLSVKQQPSPSYTLLIDHVAWQTVALVIKPAIKTQKHRLILSYTGVFITSLSPGFDQI